MRRPRFTIRRIMTWILVLAAAFAYLAEAERESRASRCGTPSLIAEAVLVVLAILYIPARILAFAIKHRRY